MSQQGGTHQNGAIKIYNPTTLGTPLGQYSHMTRVRASEFLFLAGMCAVDKQDKSVGVGDFEAQMEQIMKNIDGALQSAGANLGNVVLLTTYLTSPDYIPMLMKYRKRRFPELFPSGNYPPNTLLMVERLVHPEFMLEIQAIAALP